MRLSISLPLMMALLVSTLATPVAFAQPFPAALPPLTPIAMDPVLGQICAGIPEPGFGPAQCDLVKRELDIRMRAGQIFPELTRIGFDPTAGLICAGPLGPGPCTTVARWMAMQQLAQQQIPPLTQIGSAPGVGPICAGPLGPGPCEAVRLYLMQASIRSPVGNLHLQNPQIVQTAPDDLEPMCNGPFGQMPCVLLGQLGLDAITDINIPNSGSFGIPQTWGARKLAAACAQATGLDIGAFASCTGHQVILTEKQQGLLDCAATNSTAEQFGRCAALQTGMRLSDDQRILADCALKSKGAPSAFASCAGGSFADRALTADEQAIIACAVGQDVTSSSFVQCAGPRFLKGQQKAVLECAVNAADTGSFVTCAAPSAGIRMSEDQRLLAKCAMSSDGDANAFATCAGGSFLTKSLGPNEQAVLNCASNSNGDVSSFGGCAAGKILGNDLNGEQRVALECAGGSGGDPTSFAGCAAANMFSMQLNPEQQIAVQCVAGTGGNPPAAAGCMASRLTLRELTKCYSDGVGGKGCFGDSNDLVGKNGFVGRTLAEIASGPNSVINNPGQIWGGDSSFVRSPGQIWGGPRSFVRNPEQIWGGPNSVFNHPEQLAPKPLQLGTIGGKRICLPWC